MNKAIIFFHPNFSNGGVERTNLELAKGLISNGYSVIFLTTYYTNHFIDEIDKNNIEFKSLGCKKVSRIIFDLVKYLNDISKEQEIVFISCQYYANIISMLASKFVINRDKFKFINCERSDISSLHIDKKLSLIRRSLILWLVKLTYKYADKIITNSIESSVELSSYLGLNVDFVYNPTINSRLISMKNENITEDWFIRDKRKAIIGMGRLSIEKDFETLLRAFSLFGNFKEYKLVILGDGPEKERLLSVIIDLDIKDHVYMPGFVDNPYKFLNNAALFVLSSLYEGLPNALIEAVYLNIIAISTNCKSGPKEILLDNTLLVNVGDYVSMAKKMSLVLESCNQNYYIMRNALENIDRFKSKNIIKKFIEVIEYENN